MLNWKASAAKVAEKHGVDYENFMKVFRKYDLVFGRGGHNSKQIWSTYHSELNLKKGHDFEFIEFAVRHMIPIKETHKLARQISKKYKLGLLTNLMPETFEYTLKYGHVPNLDYAAIIKSCEVGFVKPEPEIYHLAQKAAGVAHQEIFFIDDLEVNIAAAKELGWITHLFDEKNPKKSVDEIRKKLKT